MKANRVLMGCVLVLVTYLWPCVQAQALQRDAVIIDQVLVEFGQYEYNDVVRGTLWGEAQVHAAPAWSLVGGIGAGVISHDWNGNPDLWFVSLGLKRHLSGYSSIKLLGLFEWADSGDDYSIGGGSLGYERRFANVVDSISPYVALDVAVLDAKITPWNARNEQFTAMRVDLTLGCDVSLTEECVLVLQTKLTDSTSFSTSALSYGDFGDGWSIGAAMKYYWP